MIAVLSSAKTMDFESPWQAPRQTSPECLKRARVLMNRLSRLTAKDIARLMGVSPKIAQLNAQRFKQFTLPHTSGNAKPALLAYQGDVYRGMKSAAFNSGELVFAQKTLRILSGLYGVLRPLDLIQPYRLEMAIKLSGPTWENLYGYWSKEATRLIDRDALADGKVIVNLASQEYSSVLQEDKLKSRLLNIIFKQDRGGKIILIPILAKRARGLMANYIITEQLTDLEGMKQFKTDGYRFSSSDSTASEWVFIRRASLN